MVHFISIYLTDVKLLCIIIIIIIVIVIVIIIIITNTITITIIIITTTITPQEQSLQIYFNIFGLIYCCFQISPSPLIKLIKIGFKKKVNQ